MDQNKETEHPPSKKRLALPPVLRPPSSVLTTNRTNIRNFADGHVRRTVRRVRLLTKDVPRRRTTIFNLLFPIYDRREYCFTGLDGRNGWGKI